MVAETSARVVLLSEVFPPAIGGSATLFWHAYRSIGPRVTVLTEGPGPDHGDRGEFSVRRLPGAAVGWGVSRPTSLRHHVGRARALREVVGPDPAVVHCGRALPEGLAARLAYPGGAVPYVCWVHGEELAYMGSSRELRWLGRQVYRHAAGVIANSRHTAACLRAFGVTPARLAVAHPGVDASRFTVCAEDVSAVRARYASPGEHLLLSVGRLQRRKGHDLVIAALASLVRQGAPLRYLVAGDGEERGRLQAFAVETGVADRVSFVGRVTDDALPALYGACDVFVMPNRVEAGDFEGFGIVFVEAAAAGKPCIGGTTGGAPEAVEDGVTGLLVSGTDVAELAAVIARLAGDAGLRQAMGEAGRRRAREQFTWEATAAAVRRLHEDVAATVGSH